MQAQRTRDAVLAAAQSRLLSDGYAATTVAAVADDAGVSVETIYKTFASKAGLVAAIWERGLAGRGPVPAPQRSDQHAANEADPRRIIRNWGRLTAEVSPRVAPILLLIRSAAATDTEMAGLLTETDRQRLQRTRHNANALAGHLKPGVSPRPPPTSSGPTVRRLYDLLVRRRLMGRGAATANSSPSAMIAALLP